MHTILVVDDEERIRKVYKNILINQGYNVMTSSDIMEARKFLKEIPIDLILLDINMDEFRGDVLYEITQCFHHNIKIIVSSVYSIEEQKDIMPDATGYFDKSEGNQVLVEKVKKILMSGG